VVTYLARYLRGGPIKNTRLVTYDGTGVTFTCRPRQEEADGSAAPQRLTLPVADFLQRWLLHVPVPQTQVVRSYGLYHPTQAEDLAVCHTVLGQLLVCTGVVPRGGAPPPGLAQAVMGLGTARIVSPESRRPEGARDVTSIASGWAALGRLHPCAVRPTRG
jgi:hypothetical protein